jgi:hypothetical protein
LYTGDGFRPTVIVRILRQPLRLTGFFALRLTNQGVAVGLVVPVTPLRREFFTAMPAAARPLSFHVVSPRNALCVGELHELRRKPKKIQTAKKSQVWFRALQENPISRRLD